MKIKWLGNTCFRLRGKNTSIAINPDKDAKKLTAEIVLSSLKEDMAEVKDVERVFDWPGEYEMKNIPIIGFQAWTKGRGTEEKEGEKGDPTIIFYFEIDGIKCCHLGAVGHSLTSDMVKQIGDVDLLMVDVGESSNLTPKKAVEIVEAIEPKAIVPMGDGNFEKALKDLGFEKAEKVDDFSIKSSGELPQDKRTLVYLNKA